MIRRIAVLTLLLAAAAAATAQRRPNDPRIDMPRIEPPRRPGDVIPRLDETMEVSIVNLDVVVTDRRGERVYGLSKDDFEVREAGKVQPITNFAEYRGAPSELDPERAGVEAPPVAPAPASPRPSRTLLIVVEHQALLPARRDDLFGAMHKLIDQTMEAGDRAMVVSWRVTTMTIRQAMTHDRAAIHAALDAVGKEIGPLMFDPARMTHQEIEDRKVANLIMVDMGGAAVDVTTPARLCATRELMEIETKANAIGGLMSSMGAIEGRKVLLMAMRQFGSIAGADCYEDGVVPPDQQSRYQTTAMRAHFIETANANGFTVYPVYTGTVGFEWGSAESKLPKDLPTADEIKGLDSQSIVLNESQSMVEIADQTGGATAWGPDIVKLLPRIAEDVQSYYSIGYRGRGAGLDRVRKVTVTTKRKDLRVRMRSEIVEKSDVTRMKERVTAALSYVADTGTLGLRVMAGKTRKKSRGRLTLPIQVQVPIGQLMLVSEGNQERGAFSLFVGAGNGVVLFSDVVQRTQILSIPLRDLDRAKQSSYTYEVDLTIDPKVDRVAVGVFDEVGRQYGLLRIDHVAGGD